MRAAARRRCWRLLLSLLLTALLLVSCYQLFGLWSAYRAAQAAQRELLAYKPVPVTDSREGADSAADNNSTDTEENSSGANASLLLLQQSYADVRGWLTLDGTTVDYCLAQGADNAQYLHAGLDGAYLVSGTLFLDYRCAADFSAANSIVYGHKMKDGSMFSPLADYGGAEFFAAHDSGALYLPQQTCSLYIFAYLVVQSTDSVIYDPAVSAQTLLDYAREQARCFREPMLSDSPRILTLSTCNYERENARSVLLALILPQ